MCLASRRYERRYEGSCACTKGQQAIQALSEDMSNGPDPSFNNNSRQEILQSVGVSKNEAIAICFQTLGHSNCVSWYEERSRRIIASLFGKVMTRKQSINPTSIIKLMREKPRKYGCISVMSLSKTSELTLQDSPALMGAYPAFEEVMVFLLGRPSSTSAPRKFKAGIVVFFKALFLNCDGVQ